MGVCHPINNDNCWGHLLLSELQLDPVQVDQSVSNVSELVARLSLVRRSTVGDLSGADIQNFIGPIEERIEELFDGKNITQRIAARNNPSNIEGEEDDEVNITGESVSEQEISRISKRIFGDHFSSF